MMPGQNRSILGPHPTPNEIKKSRTAHIGQFGFSIQTKTAILSQPGYDVDVNYLIASSPLIKGSTLLILPFRCLFW